MYGTGENGNPAQAGNIIFEATEKVTLDNNSRVYSEVGSESFGNGGSINIKAPEVFLNNDAFLITQIQENGEGKAGDINIIETGRFSASGGSGLYATTSGQGSAGSININASKDVNFDAGGAFSWVNGKAEGDGGNIYINTNKLSVTGGAQILTRTYGTGNAGSVTIHATDTVFLTGFEGNSQPTIGSDVVGGSSGNGNDIKIQARSIVLDNQAIAAASILDGKGENGNPAQAGNIIFEATEKVTLDNNSRVYSEVGSESFGSGGSINIKAPEVFLNNNASLITQIQENGRGKAGDINIIETGRFSASGGSGLYATTRGNGDAGNVTVNAKDAVSLTNSGFFVDSTGSGNTGDIEIKSPKITLDNLGKLNAESASGNGGNIFLNADNLLLLRRGSQITTNAGTAQQGGDGGNININSKFIVAIPKENSDITANAFSGSGGSVEIDSQGVFGIEARDRQTSQSDITASSEQGVQGVTNINAPDNSTIQNSLIELPQNLIDSEALIATSCVVRSKERNGTFYIIAKQGFPYSPGDAVPSKYSAVEVQSVPNNTSAKPRRRWKMGDPIVEPTGVYRLANGRRILSRECGK